MNGGNIDRNVIKDIFIEVLNEHKDILAKEGDKLQKNEDVKEIKL